MFPWPNIDLQLCLQCCKFLLNLQSRSLLVDATYSLHNRKAVLYKGISNLLDALVVGIDTPAVVEASISILLQ
jgi:hypothetical protein